MPVRRSACRHAPRERIEDALLLAHLTDQQFRDGRGKRRGMTEDVFSTDYLVNGLGVEDDRESVRVGLNAGFAEEEAVLPAVERGLIIGRAVPLVVVALAFDLSLVPRHVALHLEADPPEQV